MRKLNKPIFITTQLKYYMIENINIYTKIHSNPSNSHQDIKTTINVNLIVVISRSLRWPKPKSVALTMKVSLLHFFVQNAVPIHLVDVEILN